MKGLHRTTGIFSALFLVLLACTGFLLHHVDAIESFFYSPSEGIFRVPWLPSTIQMNPADSSQIWVGTVRGVYISYNNGDSFAPLDYPFPKDKVTQITFSQNEAQNRIFIVQEDRVILESSNGGTEWRQLTIPDNIDEVHGITIDPDDAALFIASDIGLHKSRDNGETWEVISQASSGKFKRFIRELHTGHIFAPLLVYLYDISAIILIILVITGIGLAYPRRKTGGAPRPRL